jgi:hypothetical protein
LNFEISTPPNVHDHDLGQPAQTDNAAHRDEKKKIKPEIGNASAKGIRHPSINKKKKSLEPIPL